MTSYRHFKGGIYQLLHIGEHSETKEKMVVYKSISNKVYVRPYDMFFGKVQVEGKEVSRFTEVKDTE